MMCVEQVLSRIFGREADNTYPLSYTICVRGKTLGAQSVENMNSSKPSNSDCCKPFDLESIVECDRKTCNNRRVPNGESLDPFEISQNKVKALTEAPNPCTSVDLMYVFRTGQENLT